MYCAKFSEEIQKLMYIVNPYIEKCHLREDAPQDIKETYKKIQVKLDELKMQTFDSVVIGEKDI